MIAAPSNPTTHHAKTNTQTNTHHTTHRTATPAEQQRPHHPHHHPSYQQRSERAPPAMKPRATAAAASAPTDAAAAGACCGGGRRAAAGAGAGERAAAAVGRTFSPTCCAACRCARGCLPSSTAPQSPPHRWRSSRRRRLRCCQSPWCRATRWVEAVCGWLLEAQGVSLCAVQCPNNSPNATPPHTHTLTALPPHQNNNHPTG